jgi:hypothetical protein
MEYINRSQTHECGNWDSGRTIPFLENLLLIFGIGSLQCVTILHQGKQEVTYLYLPLQVWKESQDAASRGAG